MREALAIFKRPPQHDPPLNFPFPLHTGANKPCPLTAQDKSPPSPLRRAAHIPSLPWRCAPQPLLIFYSPHRIHIKGCASHKGIFSPQTKGGPCSGLLPHFAYTLMQIHYVTITDHHIHLLWQIINSLTQGSSPGGTAPTLLLHSKRAMDTGQDRKRN